ncbi:MAG: hypothetical protein IJK97_06205 [Thermoguttaceae bacterium]|nr:hypothetical protein [Thermoguttaceae bacterium]
MKIVISIIPELSLLVNFYPKELQDLGVLEKTEYEKAQDEQEKKRRKKCRKQQRKDHEKNRPMNLTQEQQNALFPQKERQSKEK